MITLWQAERAEDAILRSSLCAHVDRTARSARRPNRRRPACRLRGNPRPRPTRDRRCAKGVGLFRRAISHYGRGGWIGIEPATSVLALPSVCRRMLTTPSKFPVPKAPASRSMWRMSSRHCPHFRRNSKSAISSRTSYPRAANFAARAQQDTEGGLSIESGAEMLGAFLQTRWFRPAGIQSAEDFDRPEALHAVIDQINTTRTDTFDVMSNSTLAIAA